MGHVHIEAVEGLPAGAAWAAFLDLNEALFGFGEEAEHLQGLFAQQRRLLLLLASLEGEPVGYKLGFQMEPGTFESWRGGVLPAARRQGIARQLMDAQHAWCRAAGFRFVQTLTSADNAPMLILNLRSGFRITGTKGNRAGRLKVLQEKRLDG